MRIVLCGAKGGHKVSQIKGKNVICHSKPELGADWCSLGEERGAEAKGILSTQTAQDWKLPTKPWA